MVILCRQKQCDHLYRTPYKKNSTTNMYRFNLILFAILLTIGKASANTIYDIADMSEDPINSGVYATCITDYNTANNGGIQIKNGSSTYGFTGDTWDLNLGSGWQNIASSDYHDMYVKENSNNWSGNFILQYRIQGSTHQVNAMKASAYIFGMVNNATSWSESNKVVLSWTDGCFVAEDVEVKADNSCYFRYKTGDISYYPSSDRVNPTGTIVTANAGSSNNSFYLPKGKYTIYISSDGSKIKAVKQSSKSGYYLYGNISGENNWSDADASKRIQLTTKNPNNSAEYVVDVVSYNQPGYFRYVWNGIELCPDTKTGGNFHLTEGTPGPSKEYTEGMSSCYVLEKNVKYKVYVSSNSVRVELDRSGETATTVFLSGQFNSQKWSDSNRMNFTYNNGLFSGTFNITNGIDNNNAKGIYLRLNINGKWYGAEGKNTDMAGTHSYTSYKADYNFTLTQEGQYSITVDPATGKITANRLGDVRSTPNIYITGHPGHKPNSSEVFQAGYKSESQNTEVYFNPEDPDELLIPWRFADKESSSSMTSGQMYWFLCVDGNDDHRYVPSNTKNANVSAFPGDSFTADAGNLFYKTGDFSSFFTSPGDYIVAVKLNSENKPVRVAIRGQIEYPTEVFLFGDIEGYTDDTYGCDLFRGIEMKDTKYDLGLESIYPDATGYYVARNVKFLRHQKSWNTSTYDNYYQNSGNTNSHAVFSFTSRMASETEANGVGRDQQFDLLGTRYSSISDATHPAYDNGYIRITPFNFDHLRWDNNEKVFYLEDATGNIDYLNDKSKGFQDMTINSVNATCFTVNLDATGTSQTLRMEYNSGDLLPDDTYDVLLDLRNHRVALSRQHMSVSVDGPEVAFGENLVNVYNMQGVLIRANVMAKDATNGLAAGLYIIGKKKVIVR